MRVLLIGQKIITLEDLNSYFFEHHIHGYASAGAPNLLSLDIVRRCGIHLVICQTSDYSLDHVLTFMNKIKAHDPQIVTLLITENAELVKIHDNLLELVDDFLVQPFTPSEFHARLLKLIAKSTSPNSKSSPEERLKSLLALMAEYPEHSESLGSDPEENHDQEMETGRRFADGRRSLSYDDDVDELDLEMEAYLPDIDLLGSKPGRPQVKTQVAEADPNLAELIADIDFDQEPLLSELSNKDAQENNESDETAKAMRWKALASGLDDHGESVLRGTQDFTQGLTPKTQNNPTHPTGDKGPDPQDREMRDESKESQDSHFGRFLEFLGRATYLLMITVLVLFSVIVIKSHYDGGVATFGEYGIYANTGTILDAPSNLARDSEAGTMVFASGVGVRPTQPYGSLILFEIPWLGYLMDFAQTALGFFLVIAGPLTLVFIVEIYYWIQRRKNKNKSY